MTEPRAPHKVLVACLGNPDRGDDGLGAAVARQLETALPGNATLIERRGDMLELIGGFKDFDALVCVDASAPMGFPGRIRRIDVANGELRAELAATSTHGFGLADAIALARTLNGAPENIVVYAVEGRRFEAGAAMSPEVAAAACEAARQVIEEVKRLSC